MLPPYYNILYCLVYVLNVSNMNEFMILYASVKCRTTEYFTLSLIYCSVLKSTILKCIEIYCAALYCTVV